MPWHYFTRTEKIVMVLIGVAIVLVAWLTADWGWVFVA